MMTSEIGSRLRELWPGVTVGEPVPLSGGFWADMYQVPVTGAPVGVAEQVVVRFAPHQTMGAKEAEVQQAVAAQGFPTPTVWASGPGQERAGWWSVMDFSPGAPLLAGLDRVAAVRRAPTLVRTLPAQLAEAAAALHRLDPGPVTAAVQLVAPEVAWSAGEVLEQLRLGAAATQRADVVAALDRLAADLPATGGEVVCHGDLHPFNILQGDGQMVVVDWTGAVVADPCFDVAFTELLLANPPLALPGWLAPVGRAAGRSLARRFVAAYARADPDVSLAPLGWFRALHSARVLVETARLRAEHGDDHGHPFALVAPAAAANLTAATGIEVRP